MPYIIITNGLPGSGKTSLVGKVQKECKLDPNVVMIRIDDFVENNKAYKTLVSDIVKKNCNDELYMCKELQRQLQDPTEQIQSMFQNAYNEVRGESQDGSKHCTDPYDEKNQLRCSDAHDQTMKKAVQEGKNIVFETVGHNDSSWLWRYKFIPDTYDVYYAFSMVDVKQNLSRVSGRAVHDMRQFLADMESNSAPRLTNINFQVAHATYLSISNTIWQLIGQKIFEQLPSNRHVIVWDNNPKSNSSENTCIYNSTKKSTIRYFANGVCRIIKQLKMVNPQLCAETNTNKRKKATRSTR